MSRLIRRMKDLQSKEQKGLTLLEVGIVIAVFALIIIGVLTAVAVVNASSRNTQVVSDLGNIRSAIVKWSAGGPVFIPARTVPSFTTAGGGMADMIGRELMGWNQFAGFLPGPLQAVGALTLTGPTLDSANPWGGHYQLIVSSARPRDFSINVDNVTPSEIGAVINQLATVGGGDITVTPFADEVTNTTSSFTVGYKQ